MTPDLGLLTKVTIGCGPSIDRDDASTVSGSDQEAFLIGKLGLKDGTELDQGISNVIEQYGRSNRNKYRAVVYYLLVMRFKPEKAYV